MTFLPSVDTETVFLDTNLVEDGPDAALRDGLKIGNRLTIGWPVSYSLEGLFASQKKQMSYEIRSQLDRYEFWLLRLACTLHPDSLASVNWFQFNVDLKHEGDENKVVPIAYHYHPQRVVEPIEVTESVEIAPKLEFEGIAVTAGKAGIALKYKTFQPKIIAGGLRTSTCYWRYTKGTGNKVLEGDREMDLIVRKQRGVGVEAKFSFEGSGRLLGLSILPAQIRKQKAAYRFGKVKPQKASSTGANYPSDDLHLPAIHQLVAKYFDNEELKTLCFKLGLDYDDLPAEGKTNKARELVLRINRLNRILNLKDEVLKERPQISWPDEDSLSP